MKKVLVVGLGQLGLPVAEYIQGMGETNAQAYGYDIREEAMNHAWRTARIPKAVDFHGFDVYIICIATHQEDNILQPQTEGIFSIIDRISKEGKDGALVSIESTVPKGTSRKVLEILNHRMHVVHAPHRWYAQEEKEHGVNQLRVIAGVGECCLQNGLQFYSGVNAVSSKDTINTTTNDPLFDVNHNASSLMNISEEGGLGIPMHPVSSVELAELTKVIENADRYLKIAFAEDLYLYCVENNLNFWELRAALNTKWNVEILEPREGIGGHCLPKDTKMFLESSQSTKSKILAAAIEVDMQYRMYRQTLSHSRIKLLDDTRKELVQTLPKSSSTISSQVIAAPTMKPGEHN